MYMYMYMYMYGVVRRRRSQYTLIGCHTTQPLFLVPPLPTPLPLLRAHSSARRAASRAAPRAAFRAWVGAQNRGFTQRDLRGPPSHLRMI